MSDTERRQDRATVSNWLGDVVISKPVQLVVAPVLLLAHGLIDPVQAKLPVAGAGFVLNAAGKWIGDRRLSQAQLSRQQLELRNSINDHLNVAVWTMRNFRPQKSEHLRANVMVVEGKELAMRARSEGYRDEETDLRWRKGEGVAGRAWEKNETLVAPEDTEIPFSLEELGSPRDRPWNISYDHGRATIELASIISTPIHRPGTRTVIGVLNFDDQRPLSESLLDSLDVRATVEGLADVLGPKLIDAGFVPDRPG
ncbi:MAG: hypothetical protein AB1679_00050 [Actinomycetota bacterium]